MQQLSRPLWRDYRHLEMSKRLPTVTAVFVQEAAINKISYNELQGAEFSESRQSFTNERIFQCFTEHEGSLLCLHVPEPFKFVA
jgi:hypothetical protein